MATAAIIGAVIDGIESAPTIYAGISQVIADLSQKGELTPDELAALNARIAAAESTAAWNRLQP